MDADSLYMALSENHLYDCILEKSTNELELLRTQDCKDDFTANATTNTSFVEPAAQNIKNMTNESLVFSKRSFGVRTCCVYAAKSIVVMTPIPTNTNSAAKF